MHARACVNCACVNMQLQSECLGSLKFYVEAKSPMSWLCIIWLWEGWLSTFMCRGTALPNNTQRCAFAVMSCEGPVRKCRRWIRKYYFKRQWLCWPLITGTLTAGALRTVGENTAVTCEMPCSWVLLCQPQQTKTNVLLSLRHETNRGLLQSHELLVNRMAAQVTFTQQPDSPLLPLEKLIHPED